MMAQGTVLQNYAHILELLLRLRQACDHPGLVVNDRQRRSQRISQEKKLTSSKQLQPSPSPSASAMLPSDILQFATSSELLSECEICMEPIEPREIWITKCGHAYCQTCISNHIRSGGEAASLCPMCNEPLQFDGGVDVQTLARLNEETAADENAILQDAAGAIQSKTLTTTTSTTIINPDDKMQTEEPQGELEAEYMEVAEPAMRSFDLRRSMAMPILPPQQNGTLKLHTPHQSKHV